MVRAHREASRRRSQRSFRRGSRSIRPTIDVLESRTLLSSITWTGSGDGKSWTDAANWSNDKVPTASDDVAINLGSNPTIQITSGPQSVHSVTSTDPIAISGGSLTVAANSTLSGGLSMTSGSLLATGSGTALTVAGATTISGANLYAQSGGTLSLPNLTAYSSNGNTFQADGTGSVLDVSALVTLTQSAGWSIDATNGGKLKLNGLTALTSVHRITIVESSGGTVLDPNLATLTGVNATLDGTDTQIANSWTTFTGATLKVTGGSYTLQGLTDLDLSSLYVESGGTLSLPNLKSYASNGVFEAEGTGSVLDVSALATLTQSGGWSIDATNGGKLKLNGLTALTSVDRITITDSNGSTLLDPNVTTLTGVNATLDGTDTQVANSWTTFTGATLKLTGGSYTLPGLTDLDGASLYVESGGTLSLPNLKSYSSNGVFEADGTGSVLDVSALATLTQSGGWSIDASNGGKLKLNGLTALTSVHGIIIQESSGSTLLDPNLTILSGVKVTLGGTDTQVASSWTTFTGGSLTLTGGSLSLAGLTDVDGSSLSALGGAGLALPGLKSYLSAGTTFQADGSGSVLDVSALSTLTQTAGWSIDATHGGKLELNGLTNVASVQGKIIIDDTNGSTLLDPNVTTLTGVSATLDGSDTQVASAWTTFTGSLALTGGSVTLPSLTDAGLSSLQLSGGAMLSLPMLVQGNLPLSSGESVTIRGTLVSDPAAGVSGATINVPQMQGFTLTLLNTGALTGTTFNVSPGTTVVLGGGTYSGSTTFNVGAGATVDLTGGYTDTYGGTLTGSGGGTVQLSGGNVILALGGLTLNFPASTFQWTGGNFNSGSGDLTNLGVMNLAGSSEKGLTNDGTLDNSGTIIETGTGNLDLHSDNVTATTLKIETGAAYLIESNSGIGFTLPGGKTAIVNAGAIKKTNGSGTSTIRVDGALSNTGTIEADSGTLSLAPATFSQLSGTTLSGGTWSALDGATLNFPAAATITSNASILSLGGAGAAITGLAGLSSNSGSFTLTSGAGFTTAGNLGNSGTLTVGAGSKFSVAGTFTQTSAGTLDLQIGGSPASGLYGQIVAGDAAALGGTMNLALVNGYGPTSGQTYPVMSFASATGSFATVTGLPSGMIATQTATHLNLTIAPNQADLLPTSVTAPTSATDGQSIAVNWHVTDQSPIAATGSWQDSVYVSATPAIIASSILLGSQIHAGGLAANASYDGRLSATLPALAPGNWYVLVEVDSHFQVADIDRANNTLVATTGQLEVGVPALTLGTPLSDSFANADQDRYYQVSVPAGGSLTIGLSSTAASGAVALYASQGTEPTPYSFQEEANVPNQPNQMVTVPQVLSAGTYYVLAHSVSGNAATAGYTILATQSVAAAVSTISPTSGGNAGSVTIEVDGLNFSPSATASLSHGSTTFNSTAIDFVSASELFATFNLAGAASGAYTLNVHQGAQSVMAASPFQVISAQAVSLNIVLTTPQYVRAGRTGTIVISYTNASNNDIVAPLLAVSSTNSKVFFSTPDDPNYFVQSAEVLAVAPSGPAGILRPGESGQLSLTLLSNDTVDNDTIPVQVSQIKAGQTINWAGQETSLQPRAFTSAAWNVVWNNLLAMVGTTTDSYNEALAQAATYLGGIGETATQVSDVSGLWSFLIAQANASFPTARLSSAVDVSLPTPGNISLAIDRSFVSSIAGRYQQGIFGLGWTTNWQAYLTAGMAAGNVSITAGGSLTFFAKQANGDYVDTVGEAGNLANSSDGYTYTATSGLQYAFLANGLLDSLQDTNGNRITLGYNSQNQLATLTYSNPSDSSEPTEQLMLTYNPQGFVSEVADANGDNWTYKYDTGGHLDSVTGPGNLATTYTYDTGTNPETANSLLSVVGPDGSQQNFTYDSQGRLSGTSQNGGADPITDTYLGQAEVATTDAAGDQTTTWFNALGLAARVASPRGGISTSVYDANGDLIGYTDAAGDNYQYTYDSNGNVTQTINPLGQTVHMTYGSLSNLTSITDAQNNTTQYQYDTAGNLRDIIYPDSTKQSFSYDPLGNMSETMEQNGDVVNYQYNAEGLIRQETFADKTSETFTYDALGDVETAETFDGSGNLTGKTTLVYNIANELTSITYPNGQYIDFTYNAKGQRTQSVDQTEFTVNYAYDALGRLSKLTDATGNRIVEYVYNSLGQLHEKLNGNGTSTAYGYDSAGELTSIRNYLPDGKTINSSFAYEYNMLGEVRSMTDAANNKTLYGYDASGQLTSVTLPGGAKITYVYNAAGDRTEVIGGSTTTSYQSNADNEITQVGTATYQYDANGNLHTVIDSSGTTTYTFNDLNQLISIIAPDGTTTAFQYSPLGFLVGENVGGTQTNFLVDSSGLGNVVASYDGSGSLIANYSYGLGLVSQTGPSGAGYYDYDASGNAIGITGAGGSYVNQYSYLPFGETTTISAALLNPFTYAGQSGVMQIGPSLFSMRARAYTPVTSQFLSNDPTGLAGADTNIRRYVGNDPLVSVDPTGTDGVDSSLASAYAWVVFQEAYAAAIAAGGIYAAGAEELAQAASLSAYQWALGPGGDLQTVLARLAEYERAHPSGSAGATVGGATNRRSQNRSPGWPLIGSGAAGGGAGDAGAGGSSVSKIVVRVAAGVSDNVQPRDPNALIGPGGFGAQGYLQPGGSWSYTVDFENDGSAAAQDIVVTQQLSPNLDWSTFQLGSFGFGPVNFAIPAGLTEYQTTVAYQNGDGSSLNVDVALDFNVQSGLLTVTYTSVDPLTGQAPSGVFDGFLPPNNSSGVGQGYVQYTVQPKSTLSTGMTITQQASVVFDINPPIPTKPPVVNTIDTTVPTSSVAKLPAMETSPNFTVGWSGSDGTGSGIAGYNVYVSDNGAAYMLWQSDTTNTSATYAGQVGHTFRFYSVATSNVGLVQPAPATFQATTKVVVPKATPPRVTHIAGTGHTTKGLTTITVSFNEALNTGSADNPSLYIVDGGVTKHGKTVYTNKLAIRSLSYNAKAHTVTIALAKPFKGAVQVTVLPGIRAANGASSSGSFSAIVK